MALSALPVLGEIYGFYILSFSRFICVQADERFRFLDLFLGFSHRQVSSCHYLFVPIHGRL
jgi:hypothetical protein